MAHYSTPTDTLSRAVQAFLKLEQRIDGMMLPHLAAQCATCPSVCCKPECGEEALASLWLRRVGEAAHGDWPAAADPGAACVALGPDGCALTAGRPIICRSYYCQRMLDACRTRWEVVYFAFISYAIRFACQVPAKTVLTWYDEDRLRDCASTIVSRVRQTHRLLDECEKLLDPDVDDLARHDAALRLI